ncbi:MAG TPA: N-acetylmuramic acid 6-phosphate etherase, partial [Candidatus Ozemobacteraceae bacterium]|nr:N-acetylmuramic acid 6-phosphate etherase [Candidatus Ozemobacteraceae bacterium]
MTQNTVQSAATSLSLTESRNPRSVYIDRQPTREIVRTFLNEDRSVFSAVEAAAESIAQAVDRIVASFRQGGRLIYIGAGTSGRLAVLDASECPPTFGVSPDLVTALIAGGTEAVFQAREGSEDDREAAVTDLKGVALRPIDTIVGITASGTTPYVISGLAFAKGIGSSTILLSCNPYGQRPDVDIHINPVVGPEVITGSTRLKSGTACKIVLNMLSSISMIRIGKVYQNLMVDVRATNEKLRGRARRIVMEGARTTPEHADSCLSRAGGEVKLAIYLARNGGTADEARQALAAANGRLAVALGEIDADDL